MKHLLVLLALFALRCGVLCLERVVVRDAQLIVNHGIYGT